MGEEYNTEDEKHIVRASGSILGGGLDSVASNFPSLFYVIYLITTPPTGYIRHPDVLNEHDHSSQNPDESVG